MRFKKRPKLKEVPPSLQTFKCPYNADKCTVTFDIFSFTLGPSGSRIVHFPGKLAEIGTLSHMMHTEIRETAIFLRPGLFCNTSRYFNAAPLPDNAPVVYHMFASGDGMTHTYEAWQAVFNSGEYYLQSYATTPAELSPPGLATECPGGHRATALFVGATPGPQLTCRTDMLGTCPMLDTYYYIIFRSARI